METDYVNCFLVETADGPQGIVWADTAAEAEAMATAEMDDAERDVSTLTVRPLPNHNLLFGEDD